jgi:nicotinate-nucleotide pyrophosphorylase (carboxylating)
MSLIPPSDAIVREAASRALGEDRGPMDVTTWATVPEERQARAVIFCKEPCVLAGLLVAERVFREEDFQLVLKALRADGETLEKGTRVLEISGQARSILVAERSALNFLQHLSGIATNTRRFVDAVAGTPTQILDTRKTTPGLRHLEKYAVACGGGTNHRIGLYDQFLIKDNHLALMGGRDQIEAAIRQARAFDPDLKLEVEADTLEQVELLAGLGVDVILLDNMTNAQMTEAVKIVAGRAKTEASGNMTLERISGVAACGVDFISVGALTHSVQAIDFSLEMIF